MILVVYVVNGGNIGFGKMLILVDLNFNIFFQVIKIEGYEICCKGFIL